MITELKESEFHRCKKLLNPEGHLEVKAVFEENHSDRIFVDDRLSPASGFIWLGSNNGIIFIGDAENEPFNNELKNFFTSAIKPEAHKAGLTGFEAIGNHAAWDTTIKKVFGENITGYKQRVYELHKDDYIEDKEPVIEQGYEVKKITKDILGNRDDTTYKNIGFLQTKILEFWTTYEKFLTEGIGYAVVNKNEIASICFSGVAAGNIHGVDIETVEFYQGKKLAQKAAHFFVRDCLENNIIPYWDCMEINTPSVTVAESLGFRIKFTYFWYRVSFEDIQ
ncbi:GNAT family N-acetyltransferase [Bacillus sp. P14.5]|uniref:GNAT family N-acetyltransferase n=1 Tax=Bacillus sp. P14.5 TaxID=1983400 RepID=UPI000DEB9BF0|nr:GNAT family N-acetyltransferase [Bacillus sp. P14.5]